MALLRPKTTSIVTQGSAAQGGVKSIASQASVARRQEIYTPGQAPSSQDLARLQQHVIEATGAVNSLPILGGVYYPNVAFPAGAGLVFQHGITDTTAAFLIARMRTVGVSPTVFEVAQVRPVAGVTILEAFTACTCDVWFYPQPSAQGNKPTQTGGVSVPTVPPPPTPIVVPPVVPVPTTSAWVTLFDLDFTAQPNQTLNADGAVTIAGKVWTKGNSVNESVATAIVAGTGLVWQPTQISAMNGGAAGTTAPFLWISLGSLGLTAPVWPYRFKVFLSVGADNGLVIADVAIVGLSTLPIPGTGIQLAYMQFRSSNITGVNTTIQTTINKQPDTNAVSTPLPLGKSILLAPDTLAAYCLQGFHAPGVAAGVAFPAESTFKPAGRNAQADPVRELAPSGALPTDMGLLLSAGRSGSGVAYTTTMQRVRIDYNAS